MTYGEKYETECRILQKRELPDALRLISEEHRQKMGRQVYVLSNSIEASRHSYYASIREQINNSDIKIELKEYIKVLDELIADKNSILNELKKHDRRIRKSDSIQVAYAIRTNRDAAKMVQNKVNALVLLKHKVYMHLITRDNFDRLQDI